MFYHFLKGVYTSPESQQYLINYMLPMGTYGRVVAGFDYLKQKNCEVDSIRDAELFADVMQSFNDLGLSSFVDSVWQLVSSILQLGNVHFDAKTLTNSTLFIRRPPLPASGTRRPVDSRAPSLSICLLCAGVCAASARSRLPRCPDLS